MGSKKPKEPSCVKTSGDAGEKALLERIEKRFARHQDDEFMLTLKEISQKYLLARLGRKNG